MIAADLSDHAPAGHRLAHAHHRCHRLVLGADAIRMSEHHHPATGDQPGEPNHPGACGQHRRTGDDGQVGAEMPRAVTRQRRCKPAQYPQ